ncbi:MAG TPA: ROK family transcriptional regulator [Ruminiclostridium sp.]
MFNINRGVNNEDLLTVNRAMVLQHLTHNGICSRADLAKEIGLTQASISKIISTLIEYDIVREVGYISGEMGRRSKGISLNFDTYKVIGVKLSRRSFSVGIFDIGGNDYDTYTEPFNDKQNATDAIKKIREVIFDFSKRASGIVAIGIAVPGPYLKKKDRIAIMTEASGWENISLYEAFSNIDDLPLFIEHDANSAAIAEWWFGNYKKNNGVMVYLLADEGIGAGIVVDGHVLSGAQGIAGEIGHVSIDVNGPRCGCGNYGCLEMYCSSLAFVKDCKQLLEQNRQSTLNKLYRLSADDIFDAAAEGDEFAKQMVSRAARFLGYGIVNIINAYDPCTIVIGNVMSHGGAAMLKEIKAIVKERILSSIYQNLTIRISSFRIDPVLYGASAIAADQFLKNPSKFIKMKKPLVE